MTVTISLGTTPEYVVEQAARSLLRIDHAGSKSLITLPMFYPSGAAVAVEVMRVGSHYQVTDCGFAYREAEMVGGEHLFGRNAGAVAERYGVSVSRRGFVGTANVEQLAGMMADVGGASVQLAHRLCERVAQRSEAEIAARLYQRLIGLFGESKVVPEATISGASSHKWRVSALVKVDGRAVAFEAVSNHHSSVYSSATMFHDIGLLDPKPVPVAVVRDKRIMGEYLGILAQAANVIQEDVSDSAIERLAACVDFR
jgi:hypothetical protein